MAKVFIRGIMERYMMESGTTDSNTGMEFGKVFLGIHILENGDILKQRDMGFITGKQGTDMKGSGSSV